jgi:hypothetical protein
MTRWCGCLLALLLACRPTESRPLTSSSGAVAASASSASSAAGGVQDEVQGYATGCPAGPVRPPFSDGAWSVSSLLCARGTLSPGQRFVLRAVPSGGNACSCPANVPCAPCMPTIVFRDTPQDQLSVTLRAQPPPGLVHGTRTDVPVRLLEWGTPPGPLAQLVWMP